MKAFRGDFVMSVFTASNFELLNEIDINNVFTKL